MADGLADFDVLVEQFGLGVVAGLDVVEDVGEEDDFELVEVEGLGDVQDEFVGVLSRVVFRRLAQDLVRFVGEAAVHELAVQLLVPAALRLER